MNNRKINGLMILSAHMLLSVLTACIIECLDALFQISPYTAVVCTTCLVLYPVPL